MFDTLIRYCRIFSEFMNVDLDNEVLYHIIHSYETYMETKTLSKRRYGIDNIDKIPVHPRIKKEFEDMKPKKDKLTKEEKRILK